MKKIRVALELKDNGFNNMNFEMPEKGNPGIGGSEYLFILLASKLCENRKYEVIIYHYSDNTLPKYSTSILVQDEFDMISRLEHDKIDVFIHQISENAEWYHALSKTSVKSMVWAHCYPSCDIIKTIENCTNEKRVVCVGKEEYDSYIDDDIINKMTYIYNMIPINDVVRDQGRLKNTVTYMGSLVPAKGFHVLAEVWKDVLKKVPDAQLNVIGSGKLYDRNAELGEYQIAQKEYEERFIKYITDEKGEMLSSINFLGVLGEEKLEVLQKTKVGVVNPTGVTETFCMSAVEMELLGIPIVTVKKWGLLDTIKHKKTGLLFRDKKMFTQYLVELLSNNELNNTYSVNARKFVCDNFDVEEIKARWYEEIEAVYNEKDVKYFGVQSNLLNDYKWLRFIIRGLRFGANMKMVPSFNTIKCTLKRIIRR